MFVRVIYAESDDEILANLTIEQDKCSLTRLANFENLSMLLLFLAYLLY